MRILQLNKRYWPHRGGVERYVRDLSATLAHQPGVAVSALVCAEEARTTRKIVDGVSLESVAGYGTLWSLPLSPGYPIALRRHLIALQSANQPTVIHHHEPFPLGVLSLLASRPLLRALPPLVLTWHSDVVRQRAVLPLYARLLRPLLDQAAAVIVPTERHITSSAFLPAVAHKCHVIPFGVDPARFESPDAAREGQALRRAWGANRTVLFLGRLVYYKGLPHLLHAMRHVNATLILAGDGRDRPSLQRLADQIGVAHKIRFLGDVPEDQLPAYYHAADVFVLPSTAPSEGFGIVQLEAMASARPVVSTSLQTGVATVNLHDQTGLVVPPGDAEALAHALTTLLDSPDRARQLGHNARARVQQHYRLDHMAERTLALYRHVTTHSAIV